MTGEGGKSLSPAPTTGLFGQKMYFSGTIPTMQAAATGNMLLLGNGLPDQCRNSHPGAGNGTGWLGRDTTYDGDTAGMLERSYIVVNSEVVGTQSGTNAFGGSVTPSLVEAFYLSL